MKLLLTKPDADLMYGIQGLFLAWLSYNRITVDRHTRIEYNTVWNFYDVHLYAGIGWTNPTHHFTDLEQLLIREGYTYKIDRSWRWEGHEQVEGRRFWIYPKTVDAQPDPAYRAEVMGDWSRAHAVEAIFEDVVYVHVPRDNAPLRQDQWSFTLKADVDCRDRHAGKRRALAMIEYVIQCVQHHMPKKVEP